MAVAEVRLQTRVLMAVAEVPGRLDILMFAPAPPRYWGIDTAPLSPEAMPFQLQTRMRMAAAEFRVQTRMHRCARTRTKGKPVPA